MDLKQLAAEYAVLVPEWAKPGMRCVDPETGIAFRVVDPAVTPGGAVGRFDTVGGFCDDLDAECAAFDRAIAAGPDLADGCTLGGLLLGLPDSHVLDCGGGEWYFAVDGHVSDRFPRGASKAEAIIRACIALAKAK